jgi:rhodanese-related sulfurtransferase
MAIHSNSEDSRILRQLYPLTTFPSEAFKELCSKINVEHVENGVIFKRGDSNPDLVYLLDGSVTLQAGELIVEVITSDSESAKFALAHQIPRKIDAVANGSAKIVRLDAHTVNNPPPAVYQEDQGYTIVEESSEDSDDWMSAVLHLPLFQFLPAANLQKILISLKTAHYAVGDVIVAKDSAVDDFFVIIKGHCLLSRQLSGGNGEIRLGAGESFGEEYLLTDYPTQETVTALSDVSLIKLEKKHFLTQIKTPTITYLPHDAMQDVQNKGAVLLDVRAPHHFENNRLNGSTNIPLLSLRSRLAEIPKDKQIIVVCGNGKASEAAAFLLHKGGFNASVLKGGMGLEETDDETVRAGAGSDQHDHALAVQSEQDVSDASGGLGLETQWAALKAENERLTQINKELAGNNAKLQAEKAQAEHRCQVMAQQLERLKEILGRLTKSK